MTTPNSNLFRYPDDKRTGEAEQIPALPSVIFDNYAEIDPASQGSAEIVWAGTVVVSSGNLRVHGRGTEPIIVQASGNARILAYGNVIVQATENNEVFAYNGAYVSASGRSVVRLYGESSLIATDYVVAELNDTSTATLLGYSQAEARDNSTVETMDGAMVYLFNSAHGTLRGVSYAHMREGSEVSAFNESRVYAYDPTVTVKLFGSARAEIAESAGDDFTIAGESQSIVFEKSVVNGYQRSGAIVRASEGSAVIRGNELLSGADTQTPAPVQESAEVAENTPDAEVHTEDNTSTETIDNSGDFNLDTTDDIDFGSVPEDDHVYQMPSADEVRGASTSQGFSLGDITDISNEENTAPTTQVETTPEQSTATPASSTLGNIEGTGNLSPQPIPEAPQVPTSTTPETPVVPETPVNEENVSRTGSSIPQPTVGTAPQQPVTPTATAPETQQVAVESNPTANVPHPNSEVQVEGDDGKQYTRRVIPAPEGETGVDQLANNGWAVITQPSGVQIDLQVIGSAEFEGKIDSSDAAREAEENTSEEEDSDDEFDIFGTSSGSEDASEFKIPGL